MQNLRIKEELYELGGSFGLEAFCLPSLRLRSYLGVRKVGCRPLAKPAFMRRGHWIVGAMVRAPAWKPHAERRRQAGYRTGEYALRQKRFG